MKRVFKNLTKGKLIIGVVVLCLMVVGGYFGYHRLIVHAGNIPTKQVVNTLAQYKAMCEKGDIDPTEEAGDKNNPFLILEIVPYYGQAEVGYLISGCEPIDFSEVNPSKYGAASDGTRSVSVHIFADEYMRDVDNNGEPDEEWSEDWKQNTDGTRKTIHGYYEKVANGNNADFVIDHYEEDTSGMFYYKDADGNEHPALRPVFRKAEEGEQAEFIWVSVYSNSASPYTITESSFNNYARKENKVIEPDAVGSTTPKGTVSYTPGEREYTIRTDSNYYCINEGGWINVNGESVFSGHAINMNDFIRTSLNLEDKSAAAVNNLRLAVKTIEPQELQNHPEWIDYADLIYIHQGYSIGAYGDFWKDTKYDSLHRVKDELGESFYKNEDDSTASARQTLTSAKFTSDNDWGWNVAKKMFFKINQLGEYDGTGTYGFAPMLFSVTALDNLNGISESVFTGDSFKTVDHQHLNYATMETGGTTYSNVRATNCGLYKFMMMNFLMDQENFYRYFFETKRQSTGEAVITENTSSNVSYNSAQADAVSQEYWSVDAFLPIAEDASSNYTLVSDEQIERYDISRYGNAYLNYPRPSLHGATFIYNSDTLLSQGFNNAAIQRNDETEAAFKWYEEEYGITYDSITPAQMVHYLLQYKKHGYDDDDIGTPDKEPMKVLEIEPCADFFLTEAYLTGMYLPASRFEGSIEVDHMTTAEFNGLKKDIIGEYDLIYIGVNTGKFNVNANNKTKYNDSDLDQFIYLHVGDQAGNVRSSGDDISKLKVTELQEYAQGGNALVLADDLSSFPVDEDGEEVTSGAYVNTYQKIVDSSSNMHTLLNSLKSKNSNKFKRNNVCKLSKLSITFLSKYCLGYMNKGYSLPSQYISGLTSSQYATLLERYEAYEGILYKITSTPKTYISDNSMADDSAEGNSGVKQKLDGSTLDFSFLIGDQDADSKYAVRLFMDLDGNGVITGDELVKDTYANNSGTTYSFSGVAAKDANGNSFTDRNGDEILVPREQSFSYDFGSNILLNLIKNKRSGALTWKFVLYNVSTPENYISATGTSWYQNPNATPAKAQLNALQIVPDAAKGSAVDLQSQLQSSGSLFATYATNLDDYEISIDTITLSEFLTQYSASGSETTEEGTAEEDYNGYIVSCGSELFAAEDNEAAVGYLTAKAQQGVGIVFTGEAVSKEAAASEAKDMLNMSRFTDSLSLYGEYNDSATAPSGGKYSDTDKLEYSYATVMEKGSGSYKVYSNDLWGNRVKYGSKASKADAVSRNNKGSITTYPYTIDASVSISGDAAQDYQLNVDNPNLVVWYSLDGEEDSLYGISPRDAANNYYLYSVSNVTYDLINLETVSDPMEMKLFINALVGSLKTMSPQVIVDSGKAVDSNYKDFKITEATEDYFGDSISSQTGSKQSESGEAMTVFKGVLQPNGASYQDYETGARRVTGGSSSGTRSDGDDDDSTPAPATPTPVPKKDPVILYSSSNAGGDNNGNWSTSDTSAFNEWADSAVLVIEYGTDNGWSGADYGIARFKDASGQTVGTLPNKAQTYSITLGDLKAMYGESGSLSYFKLEGDWQFRLITIGIFEDMDQYSAYKDGGSGEEEGGTGEDISDESDAEAMGEHEEILDKTGYVPNTATHRINFTPYTNLTGVSNVNSLKISLVTADKDKLGTSDEKTIGYVDEIYQKYTDAAGKHIFKYTATELAHTFTLAKNNFLKDKTQYYFFSDESYINNTTAYDNENTRWVRFDISNRRKSAITYLHLYYEGDVDTTYVFPLD